MAESSEIIKSGYYKNIPHVNTSKWREVAIHFEEHGRYTDIPPNTHPSSRYYKFWEEEARRSVKGYEIGDDWIPGYFYFYLNYCPIYRSIETNKQEHSDIDDLLEQAQADRIMSFPDFWDGDYQTFHYYEEAEKKGKHGAILKTRGRGFSFKGAAMCLRNYYLIPGSKSYVFANDKAFIIEDGTLTKAWEMMDHVENHTPWGKRRQRHDSALHKRASYVVDVGGLKIEKGFKSEIIGISLKNDWGKARGKRGKLILYEEGGSFPNVLSAWNMSLKSMQQGRLTHGLQIIFGTGGGSSEDLIGLEQLFYQGGAWNIHQVKNIWDDGVQNALCGHFSSVLQNMEGAMDGDGNSNIEVANKIVDHQRDVVISNTKNPEAITRFIAEEPRNPQEAVMRVGGTIYPVNDLKAHLSYLQSDPDKFDQTEYHGILEINPDTEKVEWKPKDNTRPIKKFPELDRHALEGAVVIWEHPVVNADGNVSFGVYIAGNDTYDHDQSTTDSLGSVFIFNRLTGRIVAEYTGRPQTANQYYENVRRLLLYYNARCNYENNWKGLFTYLNNRHSAHLLCDTPRIVADKIYDKSLLNRGKGTPGTEPIQKWGRELILTWLTTPVESGSEILNLHKIRSIPLLQELIYWHAKGNFDRHDALTMLMILNEDLQHLQVNTEPEERYKVSPFFSRMGMFQHKIQNANDPFVHISKRYEIQKRLAT